MVACKFSIDERERERDWVGIFLFFLFFPLKRNYFLAFISRVQIFYLHPKIFQYFSKYLSWWCLLHFKLKCRSLLCDVPLHVMEDTKMWGLGWCADITPSVCGFVVYLRLPLWFLIHGNRFTWQMINKCRCLNYCVVLFPPIEKVCVFTVCHTNSTTRDSCFCAMATSALHWGYRWHHCTHLKGSLPWWAIKCSRNSWWGGLGTALLLQSGSPRGFRLSERLLFSFLMSN